MNLDEIIRRYEDQVRLRVRKSSLLQYLWRIRRFTANVNLNKYDRRRLRSKSPQLIRMHLEGVPKLSWRAEISALKDFYRYGLRIDWPSEVVGFTGRLPPVGRREIPRGFAVEKWTEAVEKELDVYTKLVVLLIGEFGWRPDHLYKMKMRNIRYDEDGRPYAICADGRVEGFKTAAWVASYLPPIVRETLEAFLAERGSSVRPEDPLIPYRHPKGKKHPEGIENDKPLNVGLLRKVWLRFQMRHKLPKLTACDFRHFVCWKCEEADLTNSASAYLTGHDSSHGETYRNWYANLSIEDALLEQKEKIPNGILGLLRKPEVELVREMPRPMIDLVTQFLDGKTGELDFAIQAGKIRSAMQTESPRNLEP